MSAARSWLLRLKRRSERKNGGQKFLPFSWKWCVRAGSYVYLHIYIYTACHACIHAYPSIDVKTKKGLSVHWAVLEQELVYGGSGQFMMCTMHWMVASLIIHIIFIGMQVNPARAAIQGFGLLKHAADDIENPTKVRVLLQELYEIRLSKITYHFHKLEVCTRRYSF